MKKFTADIHIHTVLSPCGDLEMSPVNIVRRAKEQKLDIIGITDHNATGHNQVVAELAGREDIMVLMGTEVNTREEVHCLVFFENWEILNDFQVFLDNHLPVVNNRPELFGYQVEVDEHENIIRTEERLLISALHAGLDEIAEKTRQLKGICIPAHIDKAKNSIFSQLGFIPANFSYDALEISGQNCASAVHLPGIQDATLVRNSDAHYLQDIGTNKMCFHLEERSFNEIKMALAGLNGRSVELL